MPRSTWKPAWIPKKPESPSHAHLSSFPARMQGEDLYTRSMQVVHQCIGKNVSISTGKSTIQVHITEAMVGKKLGEFALTRKLTNHAKKGKKKKG